MKQNVWEKEYKNVSNLWGLIPNNILSTYIELLPEGGKVLDIGVGEGRNALFFAKTGFEVEGIDISETAISRCLELSKEYDVRIDAKVDDITTFEIKKEEYSLIILSNVLNFFSDSDIQLIMNKVKNGLKDGGLIYISVFDNEEPSLEMVKERYNQITDSTYYNEKINMYYHFFTQEEVKGLVSDFELICFINSYSLDNSHGKPHYHSGLEILSRKTVK